MLAFFLLFASSFSTNGAPTSDPHDEVRLGARSGAYCELIGTERMRVSCFTVSRDDDGVAVHGTAHSGGSLFATWRSDAVLADSGTSVVYRYTADMGGRRVPGVSHVVLPPTGGLGAGWYMADDGTRTPFALRDRASLVACLGTDPEDADSAALRGCAK